MSKIFVFVFSLFFLETAYSAEVQPTVLLINMFTESAQEFPDLQLGTFVQNIEASFETNGLEPKILSIEVDRREKNEKKRVQKLFQRMDYFISNPNLKITHIFFAGHGASFKENLVIGDLIFDQTTIGGLVQSFARVRNALAPKVKVFLFGCSTFEGTEEEVSKRAHWFRRLLKVQELEVFGYNTKVLSSVSHSFYSLSFNEAAITGVGIAFLTAFRFAADHNRLLDPIIWKNFIKSLVLVPAFATSHYIFLHYLKHTSAITFLRELFFYDYLGTLVKFKGSKITDKENLLGHDYVSQQYSKL